MKDKLESLFRLTKDLEGNHDLKDHARKASHGALWEVLISRRLNGLRLVLRATGGIAICQVIRLQVRKEECNV